MDRLWYSLKAFIDSLSSCFDLGRGLREYFRIQGEAHSLCRKSDKERHSYIRFTSGLTTWPIFEAIRNPKPTDGLSWKHCHSDALRVIRPQQLQGCEAARGSGVGLKSCHFKPLFLDRPGSWTIDLLNIPYHDLSNMFLSLYAYFYLFMLSILLFPFSPLLWQASLVSGSSLRRPLRQKRAQPQATASLRVCGRTKARRAS